MKRITKIALSIFAFAALMWFYYSNNEAIARQYPNELLFWELVTTVTAPVAGTLLLVTGWLGHLPAKRWKDAGLTGRPCRMVIDDKNDIKSMSFPN